MEILATEFKSVEQLRDMVTTNPDAYANDASLLVLIDRIQILTEKCVAYQRMVNTVSGAHCSDEVKLRYSDLHGAHSEYVNGESVNFKNSNLCGTDSNPNSPVYDAATESIKPLTPQELSDITDAQRWRRLVNCGRIHVFGTSGFRNDAVVDPLQPYHFGVEFHAIHNAEQNPRDLQILTNFVDALEVTNISGVVELWGKLGHFPTRDEVMYNLQSNVGGDGFKAFCKMIEVPMSFQQEQILDTIVDNKP